ncbi:MAG: hypothetical protein ACUVX1_10215 [Chloroflexota bacterium]
MGSAWTDGVGMARRWGLRASLSIFDQALVSGANFIANVLLARWLTPIEFGAFAVGFSVFLFVSGLHGALVVEPMSVLGVERQNLRFSEYLASVLAAHTVLTVCLAVLLAFGALLLEDEMLKSSVLAVAVMMPAVLLFWTVRRAFYIEAGPEGAVCGSLVYALVLLICLLALWGAGWLSAPAGLMAMGLAGAIAGLVGCVRLRLPWDRATVLRVWHGTRAVLSQHWTYGQWVVLATILSLATTQAQMFLTAGIVGLQGAGTLRAMLVFVLPMVQVTTALGVLDLPRLASDFSQGDLNRLRRRTEAVTLGLAGIAVVYQLALWLLAGQLESLLYGGKYASWAWIIPVLGLVPIFSALATGYARPLRAARRPDLCLVASALSAPVTLIAAWLLTNSQGVGGAALSMVFIYLVLAGITYYLYRRYLPGLRPVA